MMQQQTGYVIAINKPLHSRTPYSCNLQLKNRNGTCLNFTVSQYKVYDWGSLSEIHTIDNHSQQIWEYHCSKTRINIILLKKEKFNPHKQYCSCPHSTKQEVQSVIFPCIKGK